MMKKIFLIFFLLNIFIFNVNADELLRSEVSLIKCEDAITSWVLIDGEKKIIRLIATDTSDGSLNKEIDSYVCKKLNEVKKIEIEYDPNYEGVDEYNRLNVWVYVDSVLLQEDLIEKGYAQVNYVTGDYLYLDTLCERQGDAISRHLGIWNYPNQEEKYCMSGINLDSNSSNEVEEENDDLNNDTSYLIDIIFLDILIVVLVLMIALKRRRNG